MGVMCVYIREAMSILLSFCSYLVSTILHRHMFGILTLLLHHYTQKKEYLPKSLLKHNFLFLYGTCSVYYYS